MFYVMTLFDNLILSTGEKSIHIDDILQLISRCSKVPEALGSRLRTLNQMNRIFDYKSANLDFYLTLMLMKCVTLDKLCIFCALKSSFINMIANIGNNLFLNITETFWLCGGILLYKTKVILLLKVMCDPDTVHNKCQFHISTCIYLFSSFAHRRDKPHMKFFSRALHSY